MKIKPRRSLLFAPGSNARALEKAKTLPADCVILDLEDSVVPEQKDSARSELAQALGSSAFGGREIVVRVNGLNTPWGAGRAGRDRRDGEVRIALWRGSLGDDRDRVRRAQRG
jgi:citrate lyase subunit beta/citryl-CoA lyase